MARSLSLAKIRRSRTPEDLVPKTFKLHPDVVDAFERQAVDEGSNQGNLIEKLIIFYVNHGGKEAKIG